MKIEVTREDILKGRVRNPWYCPIALAAKRVCKDKDSVVVGIDTICIDNKTYLLPLEADNFRRCFDSQSKFSRQGFVFELKD